MTVGKIAGITYLRAILSVFVVVWHSGVFSGTGLYHRSGLTAFSLAWKDVLVFNVLLLAVPMFFLMSCYLYAGKDRDLRYLRTRLWTLVMLAGFWSIFYKIWKSGYPGLKTLIPGGFMDAVELALSAGNTIYYFFVILIILLILTHLLKYGPAWTHYTGFLIGLFVLPALCRLTVFYDIKYFSVFWNPLNFIVYPFAAHMLIHLNRKKSPQLILSIIGILALSAAAAEWYLFVDESFFDGHGFRFPAYTRISLVLFSLLLFRIALSIKGSPPAMIKSMSAYSLALYCVHPFLLMFLKRIDNLNLELIALPLFIAACYATAYLLGFILKKELLFS